MHPIRHFSLHFNTVFVILMSTNSLSSLRIEVSSLLSLFRLYQGNDALYLTNPQYSPINFQTARTMMSNPSILA